MRKLAQALQFESLLLPSLSQNYNSNPSKKLLLSLISSSFTFSHHRACSSTPDLNAKNSVLANYLIVSLKFSKDRALSVSNSFLRTKSLEEPEKVVHFFKGLGFSDAHIQSIAHGLPFVLFADVEKTLKPKVIFFQELGLSGARLGAFISKEPSLLARSLERSLTPCVHLIKKVLESDARNKSKEKVNDELFLIIARNYRICRTKSRLEENIRYLESCGVVGSQLSALLLKQSRLFSMPKEKLEKLVSRAVDMNFTMGSRMLAHAIYCLSCMSINTLNGKFELLRMLGFSKEELDSMFRKSPQVFALSKSNLWCKVEFWLSNLKINKLRLVQNPHILTYSLEERVIPRKKVLEILKSRGLLIKDPGFVRTMVMSKQQFLEKYVLRFKDDIEELLLAYNGKLLDTSEK